jgi:FAD/FMN-containing dehydrogenase
MTLTDWSRRDVLTGAAASFAAFFAPWPARSQPAAEEWANWSGVVHWTPKRVERPASEAEVVEIVRRAARDGDVVRVAGTGHSCTPLCATPGVTVLLAAMRGIETADLAARSATVQAGTKLYELHEPLFQAGLALENLSDIDRQAIAGAIATSTHGTGQKHRTLSALVSGARLVTGRGDVIECSETERPDILRAVQVSLGAVGIVTSVRLAVAPAFRLHERTWIAPFEECFAALDRSIADNDHFEFFWVSDRDACLIKTLNPTDATEDFERFEDPDRMVGERVGWSGSIFPSLRNRRFNEIEYALPAEEGPGCLRELRELMLNKHKDITWPLEYRTVAADDIWLSQMYGRATVTISAHQAANLPYEPFFADVEAIFRNHRGRPHWGKMNHLAAKELRELYPRWADFLGVREELDPDGRFLNDYLRELLLG